MGALTGVFGRCGDLGDMVSSKRTVDALEATVVVLASLRLCVRGGGGSEEKDEEEAIAVSGRGRD